MLYNTTRTLSGPQGDPQYADTTRRRRAGRVIAANVPRA
jgi:hypothetical protein